MSLQSFYRADSFIGENLLGNPAAVYVSQQAMDISTMQGLARQCDVSAMAFIWSEVESYHMHAFSKTGEIQFCGHASLAACHVILFRLELHKESVTIKTPFLQFEAFKHGDIITMRLPVFTYEIVAMQGSPFQHYEFLSSMPLYYGNETFFMRLPTQEDVINFKPDNSFLKQQGIYLCITAKGDTSDFVSRFFGPLSGQNEDPVTGSAHCVLASIWSDITGQRSFTALQLSERGGKVNVSITDDYDFVMLSGLVYFKETAM